VINLKFTKVVVIDWEGKLGTYKIKNVKERGNKKYSCTFINSVGDIETQTVKEIQLHCD
jgi:hypothetical protein